MDYELRNRLSYLYDFTKQRQAPPELVEAIEDVAQRMKAMGHNGISDQTIIILAWALEKLAEVKKIAAAGKNARSTGRGEDGGERFDISAEEVAKLKKSMAAGSDGRAGRVRADAVS